MQKHQACSPPAVRLVPAVIGRPRLIHPFRLRSLVLRAKPFACELRATRFRTGSRGFHWYSLVRPLALVFMLRRLSLLASAPHTPCVLKRRRSLAVALIFCVAVLSSAFHSSDNVQSA